MNELEYELHRLQNELDDEWAELQIAHLDLPPIDGRLKDVDIDNVEDAIKHTLRYHHVLEQIVRHWKAGQSSVSGM